MTYLVLDLETTDKEYYKRKANPFYNTILTIGYKSETSEAYSEEFCKVKMRLEAGHKLINHQKYDLLIGHNIKFDLLYLWKYKDIQLFFEEGGTIWDTQLAEYILSGQRHKYPALRDIAVNKYNCPEREKKIETHYENGLSTGQMPIEDLLWDVKNDVIDTEQIYLQQIKLAKKDNMLELIKSQMEALLSTTEMEYNGFYINKQTLMENKFLLDKELKIEYNKLNKLITKYWRQNE